MGILCTAHDGRSADSFGFGLALLLDGIERRLAGEAGQAQPLTERRVA